jgi:hypothetical protein
MQITNKKACATTSFPNTAPWDDFLDLSRWRVPASSGVVRTRLVDNLALYSGNYLWIWFVLASTFGLYLNWKVLASLSVVSASWFSILEFQNGRVGISKKLGEEASPPPSTMVSFAGKNASLARASRSGGGALTRRSAPPPRSRSGSCPWRRSSSTRSRCCRRSCSPASGRCRSRAHTRRRGLWSTSPPGTNGGRRRRREDSGGNPPSANPTASSTAARRRGRRRWRSSSPNRRSPSRNADSASPRAARCESETRGIRDYSRDGKNDNVLLKSWRILRSDGKTPHASLHLTALLVNYLGGFIAPRQHVRIQCSSSE